MAQNLELKYNCAFSQVRYKVLDMKTIKTFRDEQNIETSLILGDDGRHAVVIRDLDAGELISRVNYPFAQDAECKFQYLKEKARGWSKVVES